MGDITKPQYAMRRPMLEEELQRAKPPTNPDLDRAHAILEDFARASGTPSTSPPSDASSCSRCSRRYGPRTTRSSPSNPTRRSPTTSPPRRRCEPRTQKPTRGMRQQIRERRGSVPDFAPGRLWHRGLDRTAEDSGLIAAVPHRSFTLLRLVCIGSMWGIRWRAVRAVAVDGVWNADWPSLGWRTRRGLLRAPRRSLSTRTCSTILRTRPELRRSSR
jgi:hypothetical protein